ncbi:MAG: hypothetical protein EZS26_002085 [Candidatus Ordinivivax streblomastigis]|uniref:Uncharacterized protein n=1 Tax=Candidatus Ordinivivax streblomastigis TaxID=2540710 RepID=A0A5M8P089_9BACT|nr:MAG: hypothetical protein EZS26_002085 [Candidatus Ordinivivax streblomastigis]
MFTEIPEVTNRPFVKAVWRSLEDSIFPHLQHSHPVCQSIADIYNKKLGRGIEWVIDAMPYLDDFIFYLIGDGDVLEDLKKKSVQ